MPERSRTIVLLGVAVALVAVVVFVLAGGDDGDGDRVRFDAGSDGGAGDDRDAARPLGGTGERVGEPVDSLGLALTIDPATKLSDGQVVRVSGEGFLPNASVGWSQCWQAGLDELGQAACDPRSHGGGSADADGLLAGETTAWRILVVGGREIDCATDTCIFAAGSLDDLAHSGTVVADFDPAVPPAPRPVLAATPTEGLRHDDVVTVTIDGLAPEGYIAQCLTPGELELAGQWCAPGTVEQTDRGQLVVSRVIWRDDGRIDCADVPGTCEIVARTDGRPPAAVPLAFDPSVPPPPMPELIVEPSVDLVDGQQVTVAVDEQSPPSVGHCVAGSDRDCIWLPVEDGRVAVPRRFSVVRVDVDGPGVATAVDCLDPPGCELVSFGPGAATARTAVSFDPDAPLRPDPTLAVTPLDGLTDGAVVTVTGEGFVGSTVFVVQCAGTPIDDPTGSGDHCGLADGYPSATPIGGHFEIDVAVRRHLDTANGPVDCAVTPCVIGVGSSPDDGASSEPLHFVS